MICFCTIQKSHPQNFYTKSKSAKFTKPILNQCNSVIRTFEIILRTNFIDPIFINKQKHWGVKFRLD